MKITSAFANVIAVVLLNKDLVLGENPLAEGFEKDCISTLIIIESLSEYIFSLKLKLFLELELLDLFQELLPDEESLIGFLSGIAVLRELAVNLKNKLFDVGVHDSSVVDAC